MKLILLLLPLLLSTAAASNYTQITETTFTGNSTTITISQNATMTIDNHTYTDEATLTDCPCTFNKTVVTSTPSSSNSSSLVLTGTFIQLTKTTSSNKAAALSCAGALYVAIAVALV